MRLIAAIIPLCLTVAVSAQDCTTGTASCAGSGVQVLANGVPGGDLDVTPDTELTIVGFAYVCEPEENEDLCGATSSYVNVTTPDGQTVAHDLGPICPGEWVFAEQIWTVTTPDMPVMVVNVEVGGQLACGTWQSDYVTEFIEVTSAYAQQCPGDKDGDGDADIDDLVTVMDWMDVLGVDALIDVIIHWGCEA
ncbi:MAG: hypothetical protein ACYTJ0_06770 [Planctomycetota bacterium]|jgi:hypothetical protein